MFGGSPFLTSPPVFAPRMPAQALPAPRYANERMPQRAVAPAWQQQRPADEPGQPAVPRGPVVRGQSADEPEPAPRRLAAPAPPAALVLPSPEELGVTRATSAAPRIDWDDVHRRLERLGTLAFHQQQAAGGFRVTILLPTGQRDRAHQVEADAPTVHEAVSLALVRAEKWAAR